MLQHTFVHARGIGPTTERKLWKSGVRTWNDFLLKSARGSVPRASMRSLLPTVRSSRTALAAGDIGFFADRLPGGEQWRLYPDFSERAAFVDIETTGLVPGLDDITVIGMYDGKKFRTFIRGRNLDKFPAAAAKHALLVSFNGASFDVPFLRAEFSGFRPRAHVDLRYPLARLGHRGGLKAVERAAGIRRPRHLRDLDGFDAVRLWNEFKRGRRASLDTLVEYTRLDVESLRPLAELVAKEMRSLVGFLPAT